MVKMFIIMRLVLYCSMDKLTIMTPVHVSTGIDIEMPSYHKINNSTLARYDFMDILAQLPPKILTDSKVLNELASKQPSKTALYKYIRQYVNYAELNSLYYLDYESEYDGDLEESRTDVSEQIHDLHKPYIPGSSIKGALIHAWMYFLLKLNYKKISKRIEDIFNSNPKNSPEFHDLIFGSDLEREYKDFYKELYSCLECPDLYFDKLELFYAGREGAKNGETIPTTYKECIAPLQEIEIDLFTIDQFKLDLLKKKYEGCSQYDNLLSLMNALNRKTIFDACRTFMKDILEVEMKDQFYFYEEFYGINEKLKEIREELDKPNTVIIRVGNSTNYFSKTISYWLNRYIGDFLI